VVERLTVCDSPTCTFIYPEGQTITIQAIPDFSSSFGSWEGICEGEPTDTCTVIIDETQLIDLMTYAIFLANP
jgi:hypothetical protein